MLIYGFENSPAEKQYEDLIFSDTPSLSEGISLLLCHCGLEKLVAYYCTFVVNQFDIIHKTFFFCFISNGTLCVLNFLDGLFF